MSSNMQAVDTITIPDAPQIPGLSFRGFRGPEDYPDMLAVIDGSKRADSIERTDTLEDITRNYAHLTNCDPYQDMLFTEVDGNVVGYGRVWWWDEHAGIRLFLHFAFLLPEWRRTGLRREMLRYNEQRLREIAAEHPTNRPCFFETWAADTEAELEALLAGEGYEGVRHGFEMVRPDLENIPDLPLPEGLEVRLTQPEQYKVVWKGAREAFRDEWGYFEEEWSDEQFEKWQRDPTCDPGLWPHRGLDVVGVDIAPSLIAHCRERAAEEGLEQVQFEVGDMRHLAYEDQFDAVLLLSGSFGFFEDAVNRDVLTRVTRSLKDSTTKPGRVIIDVFDLGSMVVRPPQRTWSSFGGGYDLRTIWWEPESCTYVSEFMFVDSEGVLNTAAEPERIRVYSLPEWRAMSDTACLKLTHALADTKLPPVAYDRDHNGNLVIVGERITS